MESQSTIALSVLWRDKRMELEMETNSSVRELGQKLKYLTEVKADSMRLLVPQTTTQGSKAIIPFSEEHSTLRLQDISIPKGKPIRMMGICEREIEEISQSRMKSDSRIRGFDEEEERLRQRLLTTSESVLRLPPGPYIFSDFRTLSLPGIELHPPPSEALRRMHMLACDPGIIAIMNKYRWRVGIMTEMAPVGYVGISPSCLLGFNKNQGEEISLRLRTDDLKGFRKYESIKKTLLHELAHMVHSDHNADFYALDKKLNEAVRLDWTRSGGRTLAVQRFTDNYDDVAASRPSDLRGSGAQKLGGQWMRGSPSDPRSTSAAAALRRFLAADSQEEEKKIGDDRDDGPDRVIPEPDPTGFSNRVAHEPEVDGFLDRVADTPEPVGFPDRVADPPEPDGLPDRAADPPEPDGFPEGGFGWIEEPAAAMCRRLDKAIEALHREAPPAEAASSRHTLLKIIRNLIDHPEDEKFRRLRKANRTFQRHVASYSGAMEILAVVGFSEDVVGGEASLVLKRNDPGLLWLAHSSLEVRIPDGHGTSPGL